MVVWGFPGPALDESQQGAQLLKAGLLNLVCSKCFLLRAPESTCKVVVVVEVLIIITCSSRSSNTGCSSSRRCSSGSGGGSSSGSSSSSSCSSSSKARPQAPGVFLLLQWVFLILQWFWLFRVGGGGRGGGGMLTFTQTQTIHSSRILNLEPDSLNPKL